MSTDRHATQARFAVIKKQYGTVIRTNVPPPASSPGSLATPSSGCDTLLCEKERETCEQIAAMIRAAAEEVLAFEVVAVVMGYHTLTAQ